MRAWANRAGAVGHVCRAVGAGSLLVALVAAPATAATQPVPGADDPRIASVVYRATDVVELEGHFGYSTAIRFSKAERIENVAVGDPEGWQTQPNADRNILFVKPLLEDADTNMTVVTSARTYHFALSAADAEADTPLFELSFQVPEPPRPRTLARQGSALRSANAALRVPSPFAPGSNTDYGFKGDADLAPTAIFDDGRFTYIRFAAGSDLPAVFGVDAKRNESVLNTHRRGEFTVVESVPRQITLRLGDRKACVFNRASRDDPGFQSDLGGPVEATGGSRKDASSEKEPSS